MMKTAIGTKVIRFEECCKESFNYQEKCGFDGRIPSDGDIPVVVTEGYHVQYDNPDDSVYDSWSPKNVFEAAYRDIEKGMTFGDAIHFMRQDKKVARSGWNGKGMWIKLIDNDPKIGAMGYSRLNEEEGCAIFDFDVEEFPIDNFIVMKTAKNTVCPWLASQTDVLADDWVIVE